MEFYAYLLIKISAVLFFIGFFMLVGPILYKVFLHLGVGFILILAAIIAKGAGRRRTG